MHFYTLHDFDFTGKRVLLRADFNVPVDGKGRVQDEKKIRDTLPTIKYLLSQHCRLIIASHLGRPEGKTVEGLRLTHVAKILERMLRRKIVKLDYTTGQLVEQGIRRMKPGDIVLLENVQFEPGETHNEESYARTLAGYCDYFVLDAFGQSHRDYASISGVQKFVPSCAGLLVEKELQELSVLEHADKPFVAIIGGAKHDKITVIEHLVHKVDTIIVGGILANTFLKASGIDIGNSKFDAESVEDAKRLLREHRGKLVLPSDAVIADRLDAKARVRQASVQQIPKKWMIADIGKQSIAQYKDVLKYAHTIIWAGPVGMFEVRKFEKGTKELALFLAKLKSIRIVCGGDSSAAIDKVKLAKKMTHVSSGGGAALDFISGKAMPGILALEQNYNKFRVSVKLAH
ncbi:phosphoglycerate kinase [Candidatus Woesearchaeota archaeon]|nr:phosphoglycerate kinase [Candidatus Woesearchaeota archaeon]